MPIACPATMPVEPEFPDDDAAIASAKTVFDLAKIYRAGLLQHRAFEASLLAILKGCASQ